MPGCLRGPHKGAFEWNIVAIQASSYSIFSQRSAFLQAGRLLPMHVPALATHTTGQGMITTQPPFDGDNSKVHPDRQVVCHEISILMASIATAAVGGVPRMPPMPVVHRTRKAHRQAAHAWYPRMRIYILPSSTRFNDTEGHGNRKPTAIPD